MKAAGAALVLLGGWGVWRQYTDALRRETALLGDLSAALTLLAGEIRWRRTPLPQLLRQLSRRGISGCCFLRICEDLESGNTLQMSWEKEFSKIPWAWSSILCRMEWAGDALQLQRNLSWAAQQLDRLEEVGRDRLRERSKLCAAASASAAGLLVLILI